MNLLPAALFLFYLFLPPADKVVCTLWVTEPASIEQVQAACGQIDLDQHRADFVDLETNMVVCRGRSKAVLDPYKACNLGGRLDGYRMEIVEPAGLETLLCSITSPNTSPSAEEINAQCDATALLAYAEDRAQIRLVGRVDQPAPNAPALDIPAEGGLYADVSDAAALATANDYYWLAGRLIWFGLVKPECPGGWSGLDPETLAANACGLAAAREQMLAWQNQFDADIFSAAKNEGVPAKLLKRILAAESQFWPLWGTKPAGELGLAQITPEAIDLYLRWYDPLYPSLSIKQQGWKQAETLAAMRCELCDVAQAIQKERANIGIYAKILKAYRYTSTDWRAALVRWNGEDYAKKVEN